MKTLHDYVRMVTESMSIFLSEEQIKSISKKLLASENYNLMLMELERLILSEKRSK